MSKAIFGMPPHRKCKICKSDKPVYYIGQTYPYTPYRGTSDWAKIDLDIHRVAIELLLKELTEQITPLYFDPRGRLYTYMLTTYKCPSNSAIGNSLSSNVRHLLEKSFAEKTFRLKPTFEKFKAKWSKHVAKETAPPVPKMRTKWSKTEVVCSEECFNMWVLKRK